MSEDSSGGAMTLGDYLGIARAVTVEFCQAGQGLWLLSDGDHASEGGVLEIPSHRSTREALLDVNIHLVRLGYKMLNAVNL